MVETFLADGSPFALEEAASPAEAFREGPYVRLRPERRGGDGFFIATLARE